MFTKNLVTKCTHDHYNPLPPPPTLHSYWAIVIYRQIALWIWKHCFHLVLHLVFYYGFYKRNWNCICFCHVNSTRFWKVNDLYSTQFQQNVWYIDCCHQQTPLRFVFTFQRMAITNSTGYENQQTYEELFCSEHITGGTQNYQIGISATNIFLSITAFLGNTLILVALHKESSLHPPTKLLFRSLATTDFFVGVIVEPLVVTYTISAMNQRGNICQYVYVASHITGYILSSVSLFTSTAIGVDRLLALLLGLRYRQVVTLKRTYLTVIGFWVVSIVGSTLYFLDYRITLWFGYTIVTLCLITSILSFAKIFLTLRHNRVQMQLHVRHGERSQRMQLRRKQYRKTVLNALWVQVALAICYLPHGVVEALLSLNGVTSVLFKARGIDASFVFLNSSLNPILYCWKIRDVRQAVKDTVRQLCCLSS